MSDIRERIQEILCRPQLTGFATVTENGKPWSRYVMAAGTDDMRIRCATLANSRKVSQIEKNPEVHLNCGVMNPGELSPYLQIQGQADVTTDRDERHGFWNESLKMIFEGPDDPKYAVITVTPYRIELWSPGVYVPEVWEAADQ